MPWTPSSPRGRTSSTTILKRPSPSIPTSDGPAANYRRSLAVLAAAKKKGAVTKSGLMIGLGEREEDILRTLSDLTAVGVRPPDPRPIPPADAREPPGREILFPEGIRPAEGHRPGLRVRRRRGRPARPELVPRRQAVPFGRGEGLSRCAIWCSPTSTATWKPSTRCSSSSRRSGSTITSSWGTSSATGPRPNEVIQKLLTLKPLSLVRGNHDKAVCGLDSVQTFNPIAASAIYWTKEPHHQEELRLPLPAQEEPRDRPRDDHDLPRRALRRGLLHLRRVRRGRGLLLFPDARSAFSATPTFPSSTPKRTRSSKGRSSRGDSNEVKLEKGVRYLINPGSVGQPRDRNPMAAFAIYDSDARTVKFYRVEYDIAEAQRKILEQNLPVRARRASDPRNMIKA